MVEGNIDSTAGAMRVTVPEGKMLGFGGKMSEYNPGPGKIRGFFRVSVILPGGKSEMIGVTIGHWSDAGHRQ